MILSTIGCVLSLTGNVLLIFKKRIAFWIWSIGNAAWILSGIRPLNLPLIIMNVVYVILNIIGFYHWKKKEAEDEQRNIQGR